MITENGNKLIACPVCDTISTRTFGYGVAAGPIGMYEFCDNCDYLVHFIPDTNHLHSLSKIREAEVLEAAKFYFHIECSRIQYAHEISKPKEA